ncbi:hypothetical protein STK_17310 [Sulfurisphaera tokodaii str. 7]|uniref:ABC transporter permease protein n=1 Tax=Sulfurisphaera tokodaii (strain DSM 16993 / JCM 10545 / NBRC 100140 / 7) TaxID=273063 RepID=Q96ZV4_SULTO|nr:hypothetical protein STK_17310 [Sulfurisphaera tokodaii str. 7]
MRSIRWYFKGLFPLKFMVLIITTSLLLESAVYFTSSDPKIGIQNLVMLSLMLINPLVLISAFLHVYRSKETTLFELSLLASWRGIAIARIVSALLFVLMFWSIQSFYLLLLIFLAEYKVITLNSFIILLSANTLLWLILTTLNFFVNYISIGLLISLMSTKTSSLLLGALVFFFMPFSVIILLSSYQENGIELSGPMTYFIYFLNPEWSYMFNLQYPKLINLHLIQGLTISVVVSILLIAIYYLAFIKLQFKP